jgi:putative ABC transport system permease protein
MDSLVFSNMLHRPARTIVSVLGIGIGILLIVFTVGLANGSLRDQAKREGNVGAEIFFRAPGSNGIPGSETFQLSAELVQKLEAVEGVKYAVLIGQKFVEDADTNTGKRLLDGIIFDKYTEISGLHIVDGRQFNDKTDEVIIDTAFQKQKKLKIGDTMKFYERNFTIVGIYEPAGGARAKIPLS